MKIPFILNNENIVVDTNPDTVLSKVLRENSIFSAKNGCDKGFCGACTVLLNNKPVPSCIVPMDIKQGFKAAGIDLCGYCNAGKIFEAYEIISKFEKPEKAFVSKQVSHFPCNCTETAVLVNGILMAANFRRKRLSETQTGKEYGKR